MGQSDIPRRLVAVAGVVLALLLLIATIFRNKNVSFDSINVLNNGSSEKHSVSVGGNGLISTFGGSATSGRLFKGEKINTFDEKYVLFHDYYHPPEKERSTPPIPTSPDALICDRWSVVTTIFEPSEAVQRQAKIPGWCLVVVGDKKGSTTYDLDSSENKNWVYLSVDYQEELAKHFPVVKLLPWNHFGRKNVGYVYAILHGAKAIWDFDDDNMLLSDSKMMDLPGSIPLTPTLKNSINSSIKIGKGASSGSNHTNISENKGKPGLHKPRSPSQKQGPQKLVGGKSLDSRKEDKEKETDKQDNKENDKKEVNGKDNLENNERRLHSVGNVRSLPIKAFGSHDNLDMRSLNADATLTSDSANIVTKKEETISDQVHDNVASTPSTSFPEEGSLFEVLEPADYSFISFNPYPIMGAPTFPCWPRGLPLDHIKVQNLTIRLEPKRILASTVGIVQSLANNDPDIDAIYRLTQPIPFNFPQEGKYIAVPQKSFSPYNAQATLHLYSSFWSLLLPVTVHGRVSDIWRGYVAQRLGLDIGMRLVFSPPVVVQYRNVHNYMADFDSETDLYKKSHRLLEQIHDWIPTSKSLPGRIEELWIMLYEHGYIGIDDIFIIQAWIQSLINVGYEFPELI